LGKFDIWQSQFDFRPHPDDKERIMEIFGRSQYTSFSEHREFELLRHKVAIKGMANSLLIALMPTASTSQILDNSESFEPIHSNLFKKQTLTGDNIIVNQYLQRELMQLGLWNEEMALKIESGGGSIQHITEIPEDVREIFKTAWEINPRQLTKLAAQREMYVDQSQSRNVYLSGYTAEEVGKELLYAQELDLKTVVYYLRTRPAHQAIAWSNPQWHETLLKSTTVCKNKEECTSCSG
jgi:ribonucleoside-diphosphate reductase alpha chain